MTAKHDNKVKILHIEGLGWHEVYEVKPDGRKVLIHASSNHKEPHDLNDATSVTVVEDMSWADFILRHQSNTKYA